ncbi:MAG: hypothetical protein MJ179_02700 [Treponema sp.]|nr:hypothetical protein [Treponema sp.]
MKFNNDIRIVNGYKLLAGAVLKRAILDGEPEFIDTDYGQGLLDLSGLKITDFTVVRDKGELAKELNLQRAKLRYYRQIGNEPKIKETQKKIDELKEKIELKKFSNYVK